MNSKPFFVKQDQLFFLLVCFGLVSQNHSVNSDYICEQFQVTMFLGNTLFTRKKKREREKKKEKKMLVSKWQANVGQRPYDYLPHGVNFTNAWILLLLQLIYFFLKRHLKSLNEPFLSCLIPLFGIGQFLEHRKKIERKETCIAYIIIGKERMFALLV